MSSSVGTNDKGNSSVLITKVSGTETFESPETERVKRQQGESSMRRRRKGPRGNGEEWKEHNIVGWFVCYYIICISLFSFRSSIKINLDCG